MLLGSVALLLLGVRLVQTGVFSDGMLYAALAKNMATGEGSLWIPRVSDFYENPFRAHPPLGFGLQALFFKIFGTGFWVDRFYNLLLALGTAWLIVKLWRALGGTLRTAFLPLLFWIATEHIAMDFGNNMLENPLALFALLSVYTQIRYLDRNQTGFLILAGIALVLAVFTKGPVGLFPLATLPLSILVHAPFRMSRWLDTVFLPLFYVLLTVTAVLAILVWWQPEAQNSLQEYFDYQLRGTFEREHERRYVTSWYHLPKRLFDQLLPALLLTGIGYFFQRKRKLRIQYRASATLALLLGIAASAPLMLSPYQVTYYLMPSIPYYAIALGLVMLPITQSLLERLSVKPKILKKLTLGLSVILLASLGVVGSQIGKPQSNKHARMLELIEELNARHPAPTVMGSDSASFHSAGLQGYLARFTQVQIDSVFCPTHQIVLRENRYKIIPCGQ